MNRDRACETRFVDILRFVVSNWFHVWVDAKVSRIQSQVQIASGGTNDGRCCIGTAGNFLVELPQQNSNRDR